MYAIPRALTPYSHHILIPMPEEMSDSKYTLIPKPAKMSNFYCHHTLVPIPAEIYDSTVNTP